LIGKILDKQYVILEDAGAGDQGHRYVAYDMNSLTRIKLLVEADDDGVLSGKRFSLVDNGGSAKTLPLGAMAPDTAPGTAKAGDPAGHRKKKTTQPLSLITILPAHKPPPQEAGEKPARAAGEARQWTATLQPISTLPQEHPRRAIESVQGRSDITPRGWASSPAGAVEAAAATSEVSEDAPTQPIPKISGHQGTGSEIAAALTQRGVQHARQSPSSAEPEPGAEEPRPRLEIQHSEPLPEASPPHAQAVATPSPPRPRLEVQDSAPPTGAAAPDPNFQKPPSLAQVLEKALQKGSPAMDPMDVTQPLDLESAEEVFEQYAIEPMMNPMVRSRPETRKIEAAWFAMGEEMEEEEEDAKDDPLTISQTHLKQNELERQAHGLSADQYRKFNLDLSPPILPHPPGAAPPSPQMSAPPAAKPAPEPEQGNEIPDQAGEIQSPASLRLDPPPLASAPVEEALCIEPTAPATSRAAPEMVPIPSHVPLQEDEALAGVLPRPAAHRQGSSALRKKRTSRVNLIGPHLGALEWLKETRGGTFLLGLLLGAVLTAVVTLLLK